MSPPSSPEDVAGIEPAQALPTPGLARRLASLVYEALLLTALVIVASFPLAPVLQALPQPWSRLLNQGFLLGLIGLYLVWFWRHGGQTLAMKTWRLRLVGKAGGPIGLGQAWLRYGLAVLGLAGLGIGFLWALWDRDRQFLHDRLAGTRMVYSPAFDPPKGVARTQTEEDQGG